MLFALICSAALATSSAATLDAHSVAFEAAPITVEARDPVWPDELPLLHGDGVIDLHAAPVTMPAAVPVCVERVVRTSEDQRAVAAEVLARE